jgi:hypothetical protein
MYAFSHPAMYDIKQEGYQTKQSKASSLALLTFIYLLVR